jgi:hypothetical protein
MRASLILLIAIIILRNLAIIESILKISNGHPKNSDLNSSLFCFKKVSHNRNIEKCKGIALIVNKS